MTTQTSQIEYFRKLSKEFVRAVRTADAVACGRVRAVYGDSAAQSDKELADMFGLQRAQHVVALEHGFASWDAILGASSVALRLAIMMAREPLLNDFGIGSSSDDRRLSLIERQVVFAANREVLRSKADRVEATIDWLRTNIEPTKTINRDHSSYGLKHIAEQDIGYITNGVFIAAAIIAGYPYKLNEGPNVHFGMSEKSLREVGTRRVDPARALTKFCENAVTMLRERGLDAFYQSSRERTQIAWREDGVLRTLALAAYTKTPFIVRIYVDHYTVMVTRSTAKKLGVEASWSYANVGPERPKAEISVLLDEVVPALRWALSHDVRAGSPPPPPFERAREGSPDDEWSYVWSKRADAAYRSRSAA